MDQKRCARCVVQKDDFDVLLYSHLPCISLRDHQIQTIAPHRFPVDYHLRRDVHPRVSPLLLSPHLSFLS